MTNSENNKRIAKNTMFLFFRMFFSLVIALFTTRIVLNELGVIDFGIYNIVGGIVLMMEFLKSSMSASSQRFLSFELGNKNYTRVKEIFSMSINIHLIIVFVIFVIAETIGLWFLNEKLTIPIDRLYAANWVYQFSILTFIIAIVNVSYNAIIISEEKMKIYAYISIAESLLKLVAVFLLIWTEYDNLIVYSGLIFILSLTVFIFHIIYCNLNFSSAKYTFCRDYKLFYEILNYAGWNLFGSLASVTAGQGINILLNLFFGPTINAARAISFQVSGAVKMFVTNFQIAINPQIIKSFASNDIKYMHQIVFQGSKYSFFLLYIFALPLLIETEIILKNWLNIVPNYTIIFTRLVLVNILIDTVSGTLITSAQASGKIKKYQTVIGFLLLLTLPMSYLFLYLGFSPQITIYISILISILCLCARLLIIKPLIGLPIKIFVKEVILKIISVVTISSVILVLLSSTMDEGLARLIIIIITSIFITLISIYILAMNNQEKLFIKSQINKFKTNFLN